MKKIKEAINIIHYNREGLEKYEEQYYEEPLLREIIKANRKSRYSKLHKKLDYSNYYGVRVALFMLICGHEPTGLIDDACVNKAREIYDEYFNMLLYPENEFNFKAYCALNNIDSNKIETSIHAYQLFFEVEIGKWKYDILWLRNYDDDCGVDNLIRDFPTIIDGFIDDADFEETSNGTHFLSYYADLDQSDYDYDYDEDDEDYEPDEVQVIVGAEIQGDDEKIERSKGKYNFCFEVLDVKNVDPYDEDLVAVFCRYGYLDDESDLLNELKDVETFDRTLLEHLRTQDPFVYQTLMLNPFEIGSKLSLFDIADGEYNEKRKYTDRNVLVLVDDKEFNINVKGYHFAINDKVVFNYNKKTEIGKIVGINGMLNKKDRVALRVLTEDDDEYYEDSKITAPTKTTVKSTITVKSTVPNVNEVLFDKIKELSGSSVFDDAKIMNFWNLDSSLIKELLNTTKQNINDCKYPLGGKLVNIFYCAIVKYICENEYIDVDKVKKYINELIVLGWNYSYYKAMIKNVLGMVMIVKGKSSSHEELNNWIN